MDDVQVGGGRHVRLEADVAELWLRRDVDRHVLAQPGVARVLEGNVHSVSCCPVVGDFDVISKGAVFTSRIEETITLSFLFL